MTHVNDGLFAQTAMGEVSERWTSSADGRKLHAWVVKPPAFDPGKKYPEVPSKLLTFPDEGHWVLKPGNSRLWHAVVMDWLHIWLNGAEADPKALETAYSVTK